MDWVHLTRVLLAQKPQHLEMENPGLKELLGSAAAGVQCPSSASAQPMDLGNSGWIVPVLERAVAWSHLPGLMQVIAPLSQKE